MKDYDLIVVGTGSAMNIVEPMINANPDIKIAVIDKDEPGGYALQEDAYHPNYYFILQNLSGK